MRDGAKLYGKEMLLLIGSGNGMATLHIAPVIWRDSHFVSKAVLRGREGGPSSASQYASFIKEQPKHNKCRSHKLSRGILSQKTLKY